MSDSDEPILQLEDVEVHFEEERFMESLRGSSARTVKAVDGVSLEVGKKDVVALVGESGCGKTTLGKTAVGLQRPTGGSIYYKEQDIWNAKDGMGWIDIPWHEIRNSLQIIHQDPGSSLNPNRTVITSMKVPLNRYRDDMSEATKEETIYSLLERMGLKPAEDYANRFPHQLSGGEKQRVALGRALLMQPDVILADEAVSALDVSLRVEMMDLMLELQDLFDTSFIFISHDFSNARYLAEESGGRIGIMYLGKLVEIGTPEEILHNPKHPYTKVLTWSTPTMDPDQARKDATVDPPIRSIDIPTPDDPPAGCNFNTRCESIIPPAEIDVDQEAYNDIVDVRFAIEDRELPFDLLIDDEDGPNTVTEVSVGEMTERIYDYYVSNDLGDEHADRVRTAIERVATEAVAEDIDEGALERAYEEATEILAEQYTSVCERVEPELPGTDHPAACHLYDQTESTEERIEGPGANAPRSVDD